MNSNILHPAGFIDVNTGCDGPRYTRNQPSRESPIKNVEYSNWELPAKNLLTFTRQIDEQWDKLNPEQKIIIGDLLNILILKYPDIKNYSKENKIVEQFSNVEITYESLLNSINDNQTVFYKVLYSLMNPDLSIINNIDNLYDIQTNIKYIVNSNTSFWYFIFYILIFLFGVIIGNYV